MADIARKMAPTIVAKKPVERCEDDYLFDAMTQHWDAVVAAYKQYEDKKPIVLYDLQEEQGLRLSDGRLQERVVRPVATATDQTIPGGIGRVKDGRLRSGQRGQEALVLFVGCRVNCVLRSDAMPYWGKGPISPETFYAEIGKAGGAELAAFARWVVEQAPAHGLTVFWGQRGPLLRFVHQSYAAFPFTLGQLDKSGVLSQRQSALQRRCRELQVPYEIALDYLRAVAALIPGACVKNFAQPGEETTDLVVASENARPNDWPSLLPLAKHKEEWFAAIDKAVQGISEVLDRRPQHGEKW